MDSLNDLHLKICNFQSVVCQLNPLKNLQYIRTPVQFSLRLHKKSTKSVRSILVAIRWSTTWHIFLRQITMALT